MRRELITFPQERRKIYPASFICLMRTISTKHFASVAIFRDTLPRIIRPNI